MSDVNEAADRKYSRCYPNRRFYLLLNFRNNSTPISHRQLQLQISKSRISWTLKHIHRNTYRHILFRFYTLMILKKKIRFLHSLFNSRKENADILHKIVLMGEYSFIRRQVINYHNIHVCAHENPQKDRPKLFMKMFVI